MAFARLIPSRGMIIISVLNEIQTRIEKILTAENLEEKDIHEKINRLLDYHSRVKATKKTNLD